MRIFVIILGIGLLLAACSDSINEAPRETTEQIPEETGEGPPAAARTGEAPENTPDTAPEDEDEKPDPVLPPQETTRIFTGEAGEPPELPKII